MSFEEMLRTRSAAEYADFLLPHLDAGFHVLDVGCGAGTITVGLAERLSGGRIVGVDPSGDGFSEALRYAEANGIGNVDFRVDDVHALDFDLAGKGACRGETGRFPRVRWAGGRGSGPRSARPRPRP